MRALGRLSCTQLACGGGGRNWRKEWQGAEREVQLMANQKWGKSSVQMEKGKLPGS